MASLPKHIRCCAITEYEFRKQQPWRKQCENRALHTIRGVHLCGTHFNAADKNDITVVTTFKKLDDGEFLDGVFSR